MVKYTIKSPIHCEMSKITIPTNYKLLYEAITLLIQSKIPWSIPQPSISVTNIAHTKSHVESGRQFENIVFWRPRALGGVIPIPIAPLSDGPTLVV